MIGRRAALAILGATGLVAGLRYGVPLLRDRFAGLDFAPVPDAPGFRRLTNQGAVSTLSGFDPLVGVSTTAPDTADLGGDLRAALFFAGTAGLPVAVFTDHNCPNCRALEARLAVALQGAGATLSLHHLPRLGPGSLLGARATLAAGRQGSGPEMHHRLMASRAVIDLARVRREAETLGLDIQRLLGDLDHPDIDAHLSRATALADRFGVIGTPGLVIGRTFILGLVSEAILSRIIALES